MFHDISTVRLTAFQMLSEGPSQRNECSGDNRQAWLTFPPPEKLVHPGDLCHQWRRALRRPGLALQPTQEPEVMGPIGGLFPVHRGQASCLLCVRVCV